MNARDNDVASTISEQIFLTEVKGPLLKYRILPKDSLLISIRKADKNAHHGRENKETINVKREVSFDRIIVREYGMVLGDNPSCSYGPPVQLDWHYTERPEEDVDVYEEARGERRKLPQLYLSYVKRKYLLHKAGHSDEEVEEITRQVTKARRQRSETKRFLLLSNITEFMLSTKRRVVRAISKQS
jgi:hypothetical protein